LRLAVIGLFGLAASAMLADADLHAQAASLDEVLKRAGAYVVQFKQELAGLVAQESSVQESRRSSDMIVSDTQAVPYRTLKSDLLLVRPGGSERYMEFRDVFEVDGKAVRDRQERLSKLFLDGSTSAREQMTQILAASARYNIGSVVRNLNTPVFPLIFLEPDSQPRFRFRLTNERQPTLARNQPRESEAPLKPFLVPPNAVVVEYREVQKGTFVRRAVGGGDQPSRGRFWIDAATGVVLMSEIMIDDPHVQCVIDVGYGREPGIGPHVPLEMRERYVNLRDGSTTTGTAQYSNFRRFQVLVEENIPAVRE
jgi:hypothetical protein